MKRKIYFQVSILLYLLLLVLLAIIVGAICGIILVLNDIENATTFDWVGLICCCLITCIFGYTFLRIAKNRIILDEQEIYVPGNWGGQEVKLQYETHIRYTDIKNIFFAESQNNSLDKPLNRGTLSMPYIVFDCKDGLQKRINVFYYSKKQSANLIDDIKLRAKKLGNDLQIKTGNELLNEFIEQSKK